MKRLFYSWLVMAVAALTFTGCEDVPAPYFEPTGGNGGTITPTVDPAGSGTAADPFNVAAAMQYIANGGDESATVYVKGIIVSIKEIDTDSYGNATYYISDDGTANGQLTVYRGYSLNNKKFTSDTEIAAGDEVIVCGKLVNYNGTYEFTQGNYIYQLNDQGGGGGSGTASGDGTLNNPYNPVAANELASALATGAENDKDIYIKGKISRIANNGTFTAGGTYGNATFYISEDGTETNEFYVFRTLYLGNVKYTAGQTDIKVGDEVIICGRVMNYQGNTPETVAGKSYLYSLNGDTGNGGGGGGGTASGDGTLNNPYNPIAASNLASSLAAGAENDKDVYIKGKISRIANNGTFTAGGTYGNATFYISEDGTETNEFYVFRTLYLGNVKYTAGQTDIKVGDEVIICGRVMNYQGNTPETVAGKSYLYSLNGSTSSGGGGGGGSSDATFTRSVNTSGVGITFTASGTTAGSSTTYDLTTCGLAHQAENPTFTLNNTTFTFAKGDGGTTPKYWKTGNYDEFRMYALNTLTISLSNTNVHSVSFVCTEYNGTQYVGNESATAEISGNNLVIKNNHTAASGGVQLRIKSVTITYAQ